MRRTEREALALGLLHGPAELVPVSSSGHAAALPWLLRWEIAGWEGAQRKELEVALHAGTAAALLLVLRPDGVRPAFLTAAVAPPALAGLALERRIEERLGTPLALAAGLLAGGAALVLADRTPAARGASEATARDGLWLGLAQAAALIPGVSRNGATLAAARARGFGRVDASRLSWEVALPVLVGASALKAWRLLRAEGGGPVPTAVAAGTARATIPAIGAAGAAGTAPLLVGAGAAFASTLATARAIGIERRRPLWPWAAWRAGVAAAILAVRQNRGQ
jgi:undecaprenyl-diphosphatase